MKKIMLVSEGELALGRFSMTVPVTAETIEKELGAVQCTEGAEGIVFPGVAKNVVNFSAEHASADMEYDGEMYSFEFSSI